MARWLIGRVLGAVAVVLATVVACSALVAILVPDEAPRAGVWGGTLEGVRRKLLHGDFGVSRVEPGTVPVADLFARGVAVDLGLLAGGLVAGTALGILGGRVSAARPRSRTSRALDGVASGALCAPVFLFRYRVLGLFAPSLRALA